jgi:hypothetical protein
MFINIELDSISRHFGSTNDHLNMTIVPYRALAAPSYYNTPFDIRLVLMGIGTDSASP